jgi:PIN domain nuclease of toxin-antitoxin system
MLEAVADTHTVIWYLFADQRLSARALQSIRQAATRGNQIGFSSITLAEIVYLTEKNRLPGTTLASILQAISTAGAVLAEVPFDRYIAQSMAQVDRQQIPDLPDRMIAATALYLGVPVISRDRQIQSSSIPSIW